MKSSKLTIALFALYMLVLIWIILLKTQFSFASLETIRSINLIPFGSMLTLNGLPSYSEIVYNVLAFVPFGVFLCMLRKKKSFLNLLLPIVALSLLFEVIQYVFAIGVSDVTDVIANTCGGIIGIGLFSLLNKACKENVYKVINITALVLAIGLALFIGVIRVLFLRRLGR